jgi:mono/diheme cytochrome c family protein
MADRPGGGSRIPSASRRAVAAVLALLAAACSVSVDVEPSASGDAAAGESLYAANCASCHGADLRGTDQGPSFFSIVYEPGHHADAAFFLAVRNGSPAHHWSFGDMLPVEGLGDEDIAAITAYVRAQQQEQGFEE